MRFGVAILSGITTYHGPQVGALIIPLHLASAAAHGVEVIIRFDQYVALPSFMHLWKLRPFIMFEVIHIDSTIAYPGKVNKFASHHSSTGGAAVAGILQRL